MAKKRNTNATPALAPSSPAATSQGGVLGFLSRHAVREAVESLVVAFILAFVFRTFEAEAFVIPTGSMATTLMGQHKDLLCPQCGFRYQAGASSESDDLAQQRGNPGSTREVVAATCPLCRYTANVDPRTSEGRQFSTYGGDRILVSKFNYEYSEPQRWDVTVFKYPGEPQTNYIKRLVGLPGESVRIWHGDLYIKSRGESRFRLERRDAAKLRNMAQIVYDNDYPVESMSEKGWPLRWQPWPKLDATDGQSAAADWKTTDSGRAYEFDSTDARERWLRYHHFVPSIDDWKLLKQGPLPQGYQPKPRLITDFAAYDTSVSRGDPLKQPQMLGLHWVGDLMLECQIDLKSSQGSLIFDLVKGGRHFRCAIDSQSGNANLSIDGLPEYAPKAQTTLHGRGSHKIAFANFDEQLMLWIDGASVPFDAPTSYEPLGNDRPKSDAKDAGDLAPVGIASRGAAVRVSHLRVKRDIYYIAAGDGRLADYSPGSLLQLNYDALAAFWATPALWQSAAGESPFDERREVVFPLEDDQFFVLGDNSPLSQDARLWPAERFVARKLVVGKALVIFWPHSFNQLPGTSIPFPFFPNFARMGFIR